MKKTYNRISIVQEPWSRSPNESNEIATERNLRQTYAPLLDIYKLPTFQERLDGFLGLPPNITVLMQ